MVNYDFLTSRVLFKLRSRVGSDHRQTVRRGVLCRHRRRPRPQVPQGSGPSGLLQPAELHSCHQRQVCPASTWRHWQEGLLLNLFVIIIIIIIVIIIIIIIIITIVLNCLIAQFISLHSSIFASHFKITLGFCIHIPTITAVLSVYSRLNHVGLLDFKNR